MCWSSSSGNCKGLFFASFLCQAKWSRFKILVREAGDKVKVASGNRCLACVIAVVVSVPELTFEEVMQKVKMYPDFGRLFFSVREQVESRSGVQKFRDQEVEVIQLVGSRIEHSFDLLTAAEFENMFSAKAHDVCPKLLVQLKDEKGEQFEAILLNTPGRRKLVQYIDEFILHKDRCIFEPPVMSPCFDVGFDGSW